MSDLDWSGLMTCASYNSWRNIREVLTAAFNGAISVDAYMTCPASVNNFLRQWYRRIGWDCRQMHYFRVQSLLTELLEGSLKELDATADDQLIQSYNRQWDRYLGFTRVSQRWLSRLDDWMQKEIWLPVVWEAGSRRWITRYRTWDHFLRQWRVCILDPLKQALVGAMVKGTF